MRAGFKRSRTRARVYSLYFRSLCPRWEHHRSVEKLEKLFLRERRGEQIFRRIFFFFFPSTIDLDDLERERKWRGTNLVWHKVGLFSPTSPPLPPSSLENRSAFSFTPLASRQRYWRESVPSPSSRSSLSLLLLLLRRGSRPSPPPRRRAFSHPAIGLPSGVRRERAGTYDAIGYRISAGSLIGRSTAHGRSRSPPSYD